MFSSLLLYLEIDLHYESFLKSYIVNTKHNENNRFDSKNQSMRKLKKRLNENDEKNLKPFDKKWTINQRHVILHVAYSSEQMNKRTNKKASQYIDTHQCAQSCAHNCQI